MFAQVKVMVKVKVKAKAKGNVIVGGKLYGYNISVVIVCVEYALLAMNDAHEGWSVWIYLFLANLKKCEKEKEREIKWLQFAPILLWAREAFVVVV